LEVSSYIIQNSLKKFTKSLAHFTNVNYYCITIILKANMKNSTNKNESHKRISVLIPRNIHLKLVEISAKKSIKEGESKPLSETIIEAIQLGLQSVA
jgi:hypothetical protein